MIGKTISHYRITEKLGEGAMGVVYRAEDTKLDREVALKFLSPHAIGTEEEKARFVHEAKAAAALNHPNICTVHEIDDADGQAFIAMALIEGESLSDRIARGPVELADAIDIASQIAEGLAAAHERGIVHRDMKPGNVMVTTKKRVKIMDFGLAKSPGLTRLTKTGTTTGTIAYMSPEQTRGEDVDHRTDIWSLGVMLYEMVTGKRPFVGDYDQAVVYSIVNDEPQPMTGLRTGVPMEFERIAAKAMAKRPSGRYQHVDDMLVDLQALGECLGGPSGTRAAVLPAAKKRRPAAWLIPAVVVIAVLGFFALKTRLADRAPKSAPKPVVVISFENQTGDASYDYLRAAIPNLLITSLEQSRQLDVTTWERLRDLSAQAGRSDVEFIDRDLGFELCRMDGVDAIVLGSFTKAGDVFATDAKVLDVDTKSLVVSASARGRGESSILRSQIDELSRAISRSVGVPERIVETRQTPVADVTTTSMEAYNHFLRGRASFEKFYHEEAKREFERAVELDPAFAMAYVLLGLSHGATGDAEAMNAAFGRAMSVAKNVTAKDKLYVEAWHAWQLERDLDKAIASLEKLTNEYPKEKLAHLNLAWFCGYAGQWDASTRAYERVLELDPASGQAWNGLAYDHAVNGDLERALECAERYAAACPGDPNPLDSVAEMYFRMGRLDEAIAKYCEAFEMSPDFVDDWRAGYVYALKEDYGEADRWVDRFAAKAGPGAKRVQALIWWGFYRAWLGRFDDCEMCVAEARALAEADTRRFWVDQADRMMAWSYYLKGEPERGRPFFEGWPESVHEPSYAPPYEDSPSVQVYTAERALYLALADLRGGHLRSARSRLDELERLAGDRGELHRTFWSWMDHFRDTLAAELLLAEGSIEEAIRVGEAITEPAPPFMVTGGVLLYNAPPMRDVLARAHRMNGDTDGAIAEYERLLTFDPDGRDRRLIHPVYHYLLAKLYEEKGQTERAIDEYERFLEIWKDADPGLPELEDAKARVAGLRAA